MFRVFASNGAGGVSVVLKTAQAAMQKISEFRDEGFQTVSVLDARGMTIEETELAAITQSDVGNAAR